MVFFFWAPCFCRLQTVWTVLSFLFYFLNWDFTYYYSGNVGTVSNFWTPLDEIIFKRLFRETQSPILSQCMHSVCEVKYNRTISKWPADGTRSFISIFFFHFTKNQELGQNVLLLVCIYRCLELEAWRNNFVKKVDVDVDVHQMENKQQSALLFSFSLVRKYHLIKKRDKTLFID